MHNGYDIKPNSYDVAIPTKKHAQVPIHISHINSYSTTSGLTIATYHKDGHDVVSHLSDGSTIYWLCYLHCGNTRSVST